MSATHSPTIRRRLTWLVFIASLALNIYFVQTQGGWRSDLGGDPDEAAHAVTSLMLHDYMAGGWGTPPMVFARDFYQAFPKVALGHYPPGYYLLAGIWLMPASSIHALLVLQAVLAAVLSALVYRMASRLVGLSASIVTAALLSLLPVCLQNVHLIMSDLLVLILCLAAALLWRDYLSRPTLARALGFGMLAAAAVLTKGSAMGICLIPPSTTVITRRWHLLKKPSWWLCGLPVAFLAGPWMLYSAPITAEGMLHIPLADFLPQALRYYAGMLPLILGWPLALLCIGGLARLLLLAAHRHSPLHTPSAAVLCGMVAGAAAIILAIPAGLTERYLLPMLPALLIGAAALVTWIGRSLPALRWPALLALASCALLLPPWPKKEVTGFSAAVRHTGVPRPGQQTEAWLAVSDPRGEGAIIAAAAFDCQERAPSLLRIYRGTKELSTSDWMGRGYVLAFQEDSQLLDHLDKLQVKRVFLDLSVPASKRLQHELQIEKVLGASDGRWSLDFEQPVTRSPGIHGKLLIYKRT